MTKCQQGSTYIHCKGKSLKGCQRQFNVTFVVQRAAQKNVYLNISMYKFIFVKMDRSLTQTGLKYAIKC